MSYLIDSHCHINSEELRGKSIEIINRAYSSNVKKLIIVGCNLEDSIEAVKMAEEFLQYSSIGIHPHEAKNYKNMPEEFLKLALEDRVIAIGEIGLDYYYDNSPREIQKEMFRLQLEFAREIKLPVILHIREAMKDAMEILRGYKDLKLLFHCYSGGLEYLEEVLKFKSMCAFGGALTWKNSNELREVFKRIPISNILLETDCPYMSPVPYRGRTNEPAFIKYVYEKAAELKNITLDEFSKKVIDNMKSFFDLKE